MNGTEWGCFLTYAAKLQTVIDCVSLSVIAERTSLHDNTEQDNGRTHTGRERRRVGGTYS